MKLGTEKQNKAFVQLFSAIMQENGYYDELRKFKRRQKLTYTQVAIMLKEAFLNEAPDMSPYIFMDTLEEMLASMDTKTQKLFVSISDMVDYVYDHELWK